MNPLTRTFLPAAALAALTVLAAGCAGAQSSAAGTATTAPPVSATASRAAASQAASSPAQPAPATSAPASAPAAPSSATAVASAAPTGAAGAPGATVYLAEGGSVTGTMLHAPGCAAGCELSGDGTTALWTMTWPTWNAATAVGTGTEKIDDCTPNCAQGTLHAVPVRVVLSAPVMVCAGGRATWFWTRAAFTWPSGLPAALAGANAPTNPFTYSGIASQAAKAC